MVQTRAQRAATGSRSAERLANNQAVQKYTEANRDSVNKKKVLNNVRLKGYIPMVKSFIKYGITYEDFATHRAKNPALKPIDAEELFALRFMHASADDFFAVFQVEKPDLKIQVKIKQPENAPPTPQEIDPVDTVEIPPDQITYKMAEDAFIRLTPKNALQYSNLLRRLMKMLGVAPTERYNPKDKPKWYDVDIVKMITDKSAKELADIINKSDVADNSKKDVYGTVQNLIKWVPGYRDLLIAGGADIQALTGQRNTYSSLSQQTRDNDTLKPVIPFTKFLNKRRDLGEKNKYSIEHLVASLHTYIPTRRGNEFGTVRIIYDDKTKPMEDDENAYDIRSGLLQIAKYKTSGYLGTFKKQLPDSLQGVINGYLKKHGNPAYMYGTDKPMLARKAIELFKRVFKGVIGKGDGVRELRRSTRTYYVRNAKYSLNQQRQLAFDMGHKLDQALNYQRQYDDPVFDEISDDVESDQVVKIPPKQNKKRNLKGGERSSPPKRSTRKARK